MNLSIAVRDLWAKSKRNSGSWVSLCAHMKKSGEVASRLVNEWLPGGTWDVLESGIGIETANKLVVFLATAHDLGKATPVFQFKPNPFVDEELKERVQDAGFCKPIITGKDWSIVNHALASQAILERHKIDRSVAVILGGHHGKYPSTMESDQVSSGLRAQLIGFDNQMWRDAQDKLFDYALELSRLNEDELKNIRLSVAQQMLYTGIVIMADWIASGEGEVELPAKWNIVDTDFIQTPYDFDFRFEFPAKAVQDAAIEVAFDSKKPGIVIIEAPMGSGKTEAALAAAEIMASKTNRSGLYFALPTQATADGIFSRMTKWIRKASGGDAHSFFLAHGKSAFNKEYAQLRRYNVSDVNGGSDKENSSGEVFVHDWMSGRKKGLLADFAVGTVDHLLMCALKQKHIALRHLGMANKVIVIDEVHAYDAYMDSYLYKALRWLGEYGVPVIVLSATLPANTRKSLIESYLGKNFQEPVNEGLGFRVNKVIPLPPDWAVSGAYPLITYTDGNEVEQVFPEADLKSSLEIAVERFDGDLCDKLNEALAGGGCAGIIVNTVLKAQEIAEKLLERFGNEHVRLLHSGFISIDRTEKEAELLKLLGPPDDAERPDKMIVVGTQVIEQSLDIDFDVLFTDICPMDLLIQRIGRLHRHKRDARPAKLAEPKCYVMGCGEFDGGSVAVYGEYMLMMTRYLLPERLCLPKDISRLVQAAYGGGVEVPESELKAYNETKSENDRTIRNKENRAKDFQLVDPTKGKPDLTGSLDLIKPDLPGKMGEATVRDSENSIEIILLQYIEGKYKLLPWIDGSKIIPADSAPDQETAFALAGCKVRLPGSFSKPWNIVNNIEQLESEGADLHKVWKDSHWLNGELFVVLDGEFKASLREKTIKYDRYIGLTVEK
ncbi:MAG: CRISPR-associated helicase Cas3' [Syntrophomonadaceae bacterium]|jgi:CRISPR-associated endonuclease/helicase Cas3|nr:CRISPR-associated helicase Cas3' [Syntrophomonadaceae bacterium]